MDAPPHEVPPELPSYQSLIASLEIPIQDIKNLPSLKAPPQIIPNTPNTGASKLGSSQPKRRKVTEKVSMALLARNFNRPLHKVAEEFGVCNTTFKKICRYHGIHRWPYRRRQRDQ
eukprot:JP448397.1.p1 GENE.JP448397.1~~JP448397.1.p1  ORF type:complete len:116 (+),score=6.31 JP448397.1:51-398(+)